MQFGANADVYMDETSRRNSLNLYNSYFYIIKISAAFHSKNYNKRLLLDKTVHQSETEALEESVCDRFI